MDSSPEGRSRRRASVDGAGEGSAAPRDPKKFREVRRDVVEVMGPVGGREVTGVHRDSKNTAADTASPAS